MTSFHYLKGVAGWGLYTSFQGDTLKDIPTSRSIVELLTSGLPTDGGTEGRPWAGLTVLNDHVCVFCSPTGSRTELMGALLPKAEFNGRDNQLLDVLLKLGCSVPMPAGGGSAFPPGLTIESQTPVRAEPTAWAEVIALAELLGFIMPTQRGKSLLSACQKPLSGSGDWWSPFVVEKAGTADAAHLVTFYVMQNLLVDVKVQKNNMAAMDSRVERVAKDLSEVNSRAEKVKIQARGPSKHATSRTMAVVLATLFALSAVAASRWFYQKSKGLEQTAQKLTNRLTGQEETIGLLQGAIEELKTKGGALDQFERQLSELKHKLEQQPTELKRDVGLQLSELKHKVEQQPAELKRDVERQLSEHSRQLEHRLNKIELNLIKPPPKPTAEPPDRTRIDSNGSAPQTSPSSAPQLPRNDSVKN